MSKYILSELPELLQAGVITPETAAKIEAYYDTGATESQNKLFVIFGILGAILSGLGIILILAHNWDDLSTVVKAAISFLPLLIGQAACAYSLLKKPDNTAWKESSAVFLFVGIGASISLIAQVYNISGDFSAFLLTWLLLGLPLVYIMRSSIVSLLYITGISIYCHTGDYNDRLENACWYWVLFIGILPYYLGLIRSNLKSNFIFIHHWAISLTVLFSFGALFEHAEWVMNLAYMGLCTIFYFIGSNAYFKSQKLTHTSYLILGKLGMIGLMLLYSFKWFCEDWNRDRLQTKGLFYAPEFYITIILLLAAGLLFLKKNMPKNFKGITIFEIIFLANLALLPLGNYMHVGANIFVLLMGLSEINRGSKQNDLGILNFGLLIITVLIICRFFDTELSFVLRGILFLSVGIGFFAANYLMLKKRKSDEE